LPATSYEKQEVIARFIARHHDEVEIVRNVVIDDEGQLTMMHGR
jgi:hypothetical protein